VRKRLEVLRFISGFIRDNKYCPNLRDLGSALSICQSSAYARVKRLRKAGLVDYLNNSPRTLHLTEAGEYALWNSPQSHGKAPPAEVPGESDLEAFQAIHTYPEGLERKNGLRWRCEECGTEYYHDHVCRNGINEFPILPVAVTEHTPK
jgi:hypothetical protein